MVIFIPGIQPNTGVTDEGVPTIMAYDAVTGLINVRAGTVPGGVEGGEHVIVDAAGRGGNDVEGDERDEVAAVGRTPYDSRGTIATEEEEGGAAVQVARVEGLD